MEEWGIRSSAEEAHPDAGFLRACFQLRGVSGTGMCADGMYAYCGSCESCRIRHCDHVQCAGIGREIQQRSEPEQERQYQEYYRKHTMYGGREGPLGEGTPERRKVYKGDYQIQIQRRKWRRALQQQDPEARAPQRNMIIGVVHGPGSATPGDHQEPSPETVDEGVRCHARPGESNVDTTDVV